jgi:TPR repeat protein
MKALYEAIKGTQAGWATSIFYPCFVAIGKTIRISIRQKLFRHRLLASHKNYNEYGGVKANQLAYLFLCLFLIFGLQGCGQKKDAGSSEKTSSVATTNQVLSRFEQLKADAERGDAKAQCELGGCYMTGNGVAKNKEEAVKWFRKSAAQNYAKGQMALGGCYHYGIGVTQDIAEAVKWYRMAAEQGYIYAQNILSSMYEYGDGVPKNVAESAKWLRMAAEQGDIDAESSLGSMYLTATGVSRNYSEAFKFLSKAAEQGDVTAQFNLGTMYDNVKAWHRIM